MGCRRPRRWCRRRGRRRRRGPLGLGGGGRSGRQARAGPNGRRRDGPGRHGGRARRPNATRRRYRRSGGRRGHWGRLRALGGRRRRYRQWRRRGRLRRGRQRRGRLLRRGRRTRGRRRSRGNLRRRGCRSRHRRSPRCRGLGPTLPVDREDRAAHRAAGPHSRLGHLRRVHPVNGGAVRTRDVHGLVLTTVPWLPTPGAPRRRCPGAGPPRTRIRAASWRSSSSRWQARSPGPDAQTSGVGW